MDETGRDDLLAAVLPRALEVMTAWDLAEGDDGAPGDPTEFVAAMDRVVSDVAEADQPRREMARLLFALTSLSGIVLDDLSRTTGVSRREVLQAVHRQYVSAGEA